MIKLGIGNYGMKSMQTAEAVQTIARIGYDAVELTMMPGWPSEPTTLVKPERQRIADLMDELGMVLPSLLEQIPIIGDEAEHAENLERLKRDAELGHDVSPKTPPVIQTHLGGKSQEWEKQKELVVKRLGDWAEVGRSTGTVICIKVHHKNLMDLLMLFCLVLQIQEFYFSQILYLVVEMKHQHTTLYKIHQVAFTKEQ